MACTSRFVSPRCCRPLGRLLLRSSRRKSLGPLHSSIRHASAIAFPEQDTIDLSRNSFTKHGHLPFFKIGAREVHFDPLFVRDSCRCPKCVDPQTHQKTFDTADIPGDIDARFVADEGDAVRISWVSDVPGYGPDHFTKISKKSFVRFLPKHQRDPITSLPHTWSKLFRPQHDFQYNDFLEKGDSFRQAITQLSRDGIVILKLVPDSESSVEKIGETIGPLRHTFYGRTWDVKDKPDAANVADTSGHLGLHMDLLYMQQPPGLQLLHCIRSSSEGGKSIFADGARIANIMEIFHPKLFQTLTTFQVKYQYVHPGKTYIDEKPTIELPNLRPTAEAGRGSLSRFSNINYSPLFQGRLDVNPCNEKEVAMLRDYHRAIKLFADLSKRPENQFHYRLQPGECVIFNNRRILHGRTEFTHTGGDQVEPRWLKGAYVDTDDFLSVVRTIERERLASVRLQASVESRDEPKLFEAEEGASP